MKAIILAAGEGSRLRPLSNTTPKPLIKIFDRSILEHNLENIYQFVDEIIIVVKYRKEEIIKRLGNSYKKVKITYVEQQDEKGTGAAIRMVNIGETDLLVLNGDSIFDKRDLESIIKLDGYGALVKKVEDPSKYGVFKKDSDGFALEIVEKPEVFIGNLANLGAYKFNKEIIEISKNIPLSKRGEYEITDCINIFLSRYKFKLIEASGEFIDISYPWDILKANKYFLDNLQKSKIKGTVEKGVTIKGNIILEKGAILKSGTYIEGNVYIGKNTSIGPNAYLRGPIVIGEDCHIGGAVEVKNTAMGDKTKVAHLSYIGDSILGNNVNIGGGTITANLRHDGGSISVMIEGKLVNSGLRKLGAIIGDNAKTGAKTITYPGRIIKNDSFTVPGEVVR